MTKEPPISGPRPSSSSCSSPHPTWNRTREQQKGLEEGYCQCLQGHWGTEDGKRGWEAEGGDGVEVKGGVGDGE